MDGYCLTRLQLCGCRATVQSEDESRRRLRNQKHHVLTAFSKPGRLLTWDGNRSKSGLAIPTHTANFRALVLGRLACWCIDATCCNQIRIFQHFFRSTRLKHFCTTVLSNFCFCEFLLTRFTFSYFFVVWVVPGFCPT